MKTAGLKGLFLVFSLFLTQCGTVPPAQVENTPNLPEKKTVLLANGETYAYLEQGRDSGGDTFLLLHGNASSSVHFLPLFERFNNGLNVNNQLNNVHLVAPDLRGFGDSSYKKEFSSLAELAEDVKLFADALGISKAHVVGWSAGGGIALELAASHPEFVSSLFIIAGTSYKGFPLFKRNTDGSVTPYASKKAMAQDPFMAPVLAAYKKKNASFFERAWGTTVYTVNKPSADDSKLYIAETLKQRNFIDLTWALAVFNMSTEDNGYVQGTGAISRIVCPVVFTCGLRDLMVPAATVRENAAAIAGSTLLEYENCGHSPLVDCPDRLAEDILAQAFE